MAKVKVFLEFKNNLLIDDFFLQLAGPCQGNYSKTLFNQFTSLPNFKIIY